MKYYSMKMLINILIISTLLLIKCMSIKRTQNIELHNIRIDEKIERIVRDYKQNYSKNSIIHIAFKGSITNSSNTIYMHRISNMSDLYLRSISYYSKVDNIPIIISSPKNGFIDPSNYGIGFLNEISPFLKDDMLKRSIVKNEYGGFDIENIVIRGIDHSQVWKVKIGSKIKIKKLNKNSPFLEKLFNDDVDLDKYYRVIEGGVDERNL
jgi:hypothetical protein